MTALEESDAAPALPPLSALRCVHYTSGDLGKIRSVPQGGSRPAGLYKPSGLWLSVENFEDGWRQWCEAEGFGIDRLGRTYEVGLAADAKLLWLSSPDAIDAFHSSYVRRNHPAPGLNSPDWKAVARAWSGLIIAPYIWQRRLSDGFTWYYGWDCASACIWDASAIAFTREIT